MRIFERKSFPELVNYLKNDLRIKLFYFGILNERQNNFCNQMETVV